MADFYQPGGRVSAETPRNRQPDERELPPQPQQQQPYALSLKVLRASRPPLAARSRPVNEADAPLQNGVTEGTTSKYTLTPMLALPNSFGSINLGETFSGLVAATNDSPHEVYDASMRIEIQTANSRLTLWETPPDDPNNPRVLQPGEAIEPPMLQHEIKEPGLHALVCSVAYWVPRQAPLNSSVNGTERAWRSYRKMYKLNASNPLSVKTKVHAPKHVCAPLDESAQDTAFLEVQVQNLTPDPFAFDQLRFDPSDGMLSTDLSAPFSGSIRPGDIMQCLFRVNVKPEERVAVLERARQAGGNLELGKLDIAWTGKTGDPGRLATSKLFRKLPAPALPLSGLTPQPSLQNLNRYNSAMTPLANRLSAVAMSAASSQSGGTSRPGSPTQSLSGHPRHPNANLPPHLATGTFSPSPRPSGQFERSFLHKNDLSATLYVKPPASVEGEGRKAKMDVPFKIDFELRIASIARGASGDRKRKLRLAAQHVNHYAVPASHALQDQMTAHREGQSTPVPSAGPRISSETQRPLPATPRYSHDAAPHAPTTDLPPPTPLPPYHAFARPDQHSEHRALPSRDVRYYGNSLIELDEITIDHSTPGSGQPEQASASAAEATRKEGESSEVAAVEGGMDQANTSQPDIRVSLDSTATDDIALSEVIAKRSAGRQQLATVAFSLEYLALATGIQRAGGVRILLLEDRWTDIEGKEVEAEFPSSRCTLVGHDVVAEFMVGHA